MVEIAGLVFATPQPDEVAQVAGRALGAEHRISRHEIIAIDLGAAIEIARDHGGGEGGLSVLARVFEQRHHIEGDRPDHGVLKVEQADPGKPPALGQPHQVGRVVVIQGEAPGARLGQGQDRPPGGEKAPALVVAGRRAGQRGVHRLHIGAAADQLAGMAAGAFQQHRQNPTDRGLVEGLLLDPQQRLQGVEPGRFDIVGDLAGQLGSGGAGPGEIGRAHV